MKIYAPCIGGLPGVILDAGMHELAAKLNEIDGVEAEVFPWFLWKRARSKAIDLFRAGNLDFFTPCGHSFGCWEIEKTAHDVKKHGIMVRYMGAIDPTALPPGEDEDGPGMVIPDNVEFVDEFHASFGWPAMARARGGGPKGGQYEYPHSTPHEIHSYDSGHIALGSNDEVHSIIAAQIREIAR